MQLPDKQIRFVSEFLVDLNGAQAAIRAGYSRNSARQIATRLLSKVHIRALVQEKQKEAEERLQIRRDDIIRGLLKAAQEAKEEGSPMAMIAAYREIGKMLGYYDQPVISALQDINEDQVRAMSDKELEALI
jgi:phage terminase small subunit